MILVFVEHSLLYSPQWRYKESSLLALVTFVSFSILNRLFLCGLQDPAQLDGRVSAFLKLMESKLYEMSDKEYEVSYSSFPKLLVKLILIINRTLLVNVWKCMYKIET